MRLAAPLVLALVLVTDRAGAGPVDAADRELEAGARDLATARSAVSEQERLSSARSAAAHFEASAKARRSWAAAAGAADAHLLAGSPPVASSWYWLASDAADYSEAYLAWQADALERIFAPRATVTLQPTAPPTSVQVGPWTLPPGTFDRAMALDPGEYDVSARAEGGAAFRGQLVVPGGIAGKTLFFPVRFSELAESEQEPSRTRRPPRPSSTDGMSALQIVTIVATVTLATGIAVGGGYLLFGSDNPRGLDTPEGAALVATEVVLIAGGTVVAIVAD